MSVWVSVEEIKNRMQITTDKYDNILSTLESSVQKFFQKMTNNNIEQDTIIETIPIVNRDRIIVWLTPIQSVNSLSIISYNGNVFSNIDYKVYETGMVKFNKNITGMVKIEYVGGYSVIPPDIKEAIIEEVIFLFNKTDKLDVNSISRQGESVAYANDALTPYFRLIVGMNYNPIPRRVAL